MSPVPNKPGELSIGEMEERAAQEGLEALRKIDDPEKLRGIAESRKREAEAATRTFGESATAQMKNIEARYSAEPLPAEIDKQRELIKKAHDAEAALDKEIGTLTAPKAPEEPLSEEGAILLTPEMRRKPAEETVIELTPEMANTQQEMRAIRPEEAVQAAKTVEELKNVVGVLGEVEGSDGKKYSSAELKKMIDGIANLGMPLNMLTREHGLRDRLAELIGKKTEEPEVIELTEKDIEFVDETAGKAARSAAEKEVVGETAETALKRQETGYDKLLAREAELESQIDLAEKVHKGEIPINDLTPEQKKWIRRTEIELAKEELETIRESRETVKKQIAGSPEKRKQVEDAEESRRVAERGEKFLQENFGRTEEGRKAIEFYKKNRNAVDPEHGKVTSAGIGGKGIVNLEYADGTKVERDLDGKILTERPDGSYSTTYEQPHVLEIPPVGKKEAPPAEKPPEPSAPVQAPLTAVEAPAPAAPEAAPAPPAQAPEQPAPQPTEKKEPEKSAFDKLMAEAADIKGIEDTVETMLGGMTPAMEENYLGELKDGQKKLASASVEGIKDVLTQVSRMDADDVSGLDIEQLSALRETLLKSYEAAVAHAEKKIAERSATREAETAAGEREKAAKGEEIVAKFEREAADTPRLAESLAWSMRMNEKDSDPVIEARLAAMKAEEGRPAEIRAALADHMDRDELETLTADQLERIRVAAVKGMETAYAAAKAENARQAKAEKPAEPAAAPAPEKPATAEKTHDQLVAGAQSIDELKAVINSIGEIQTLEFGVISPAQMIRMAERAYNQTLPLNRVPDAFGIRAKVKELLDKKS